jgi:glycosyltransferase involved in cell wall biosynthesis
VGEATTAISACVITLNEADRIEDCLESLSWCNDILVVDSHSTDATRKLSEEHGARVIERDWPGHVAQKEFAVREARHDWVLCIDADERISAELRDEIEALRKRDLAEHAGWQMPRLSSYLGHWIRHGSWHPDRKLRLFDRRRGRWTGRDPHDRVEVEGSVGTFSGNLLHHPYRSFADHLATIDRYTTTMAQGLRAADRRARLADIVLRPAWRFFRFYVIERGFLDGWRGFVLATLAAHYVRLKYTKLWLLDHSSEIAPSD